MFVVGQVVMLTTLVLQDKNLNANPSNRDSAPWRVIAAAQLGHGYQSRLSETHILVKGGRTVFRGALKSHMIFVFLYEGCEIPEVSPKEACSSLGYGLLNSSI